MDIIITTGITGMGTIVDITVGTIMGVMGTPGAGIAVEIVEAEATVAAAAAAAAVRINLLT